MITCKQQDHFFSTWSKLKAVALGTRMVCKICKIEYRYSRKWGTLLMILEVIFLVFSMALSIKIRSYSPYFLWLLLYCFLTHIACRIVPVYPTASSVQMIGNDEAGQGKS